MRCIAVKSATSISLLRTGAVQAQAPTGLRQSKAGRTTPYLPDMAGVMRADTAKPVVNILPGMRLIRPTVVRNPLQFRLPPAHHTCGVYPDPAFFQPAHAPSTFPAR